MVSFAENCLHPKPGEAMASRRLTVRSFLASPTTGTVTGLIGLVVPAAGLITRLLHFLLSWVGMTVAEAAGT